MNLETGAAMELDTVGELRDLAAKHTVRYEVWPHYEIKDGKRLIVGFDLELCGTHDRGHTSLSPGCDLCQQTFADLKRIAEWVLPKEERLSRYEISPFDASLHASSKGAFEVVVPIRIEHRERFFEPIDNCEERCLKEIEGKLAGLGIKNNRG